MIYAIPFLVSGSSCRIPNMKGVLICFFMKLLAAPTNILKSCLSFPVNVGSIGDDMVIIDVSR